MKAIFCTQDHIGVKGEGSAFHLSLIRGENSQKKSEKGYNKIIMFVHICTTTYQMYSVNKEVNMCD